MTAENNTGSIPPVGDRRKDRGKIVVTGKKKNKKIVALIGLVLFIVLAILAAISTYISREKPVETEPEQRDESLLTRTTADKGLAGSMDEIIRTQDRNRAEQERAKLEAENKLRIAQEERERLRKAQEELDRASKGENLPEPQAASMGGRGGNDKAPPTPAQRKLQGSILVDLGKNGSSNQQEQNGGPINDSLTGETYLNGSAKILDDRTYLLSRGTQMPCVLKTKIVTTYKGIAICILTKDIYSDNGDTLLIRRGAEFFGEQKVALTQGQARVFLAWNEVKDENVRIRIDSLGTDSLGAAGAEAWIDSHFYERFGGAIMLSAIDDSLAAISNKASGSNDVTFDNSTRNASDMASKALENSINIPPTAYVNQGEILNVLLARDVDLRSVFRNQ
ncbi:TriI protein [Yersinia aldovae]|uniref:TrbI/VirB10 family protein n=1 Tax=Yersinia aldovae TaxID=29483 RepID=UPI0005E4884E|nr:TrbI/VirB10 family protein [Yersinia aldovae]CNK25644.1 TriI protein [Yersinia aldovae]